MASTPATDSAPLAAANTTAPATEHSLSTFGGEASSSTLPASEPDTIANEKPSVPTSELSPSISPDAETSLLNASRTHHNDPSTTEATPVPQRQNAEAPTQDTTELQSIPIEDSQHALPIVPISSSAKPKPLSITLLLISGVRYPFTINSEYMIRHNIHVTDHDPMQMGVYTLKECIWKEWKDEEWNVKPPSANFIRLIHFGRLLDDRHQLKDCRLNPDTPNVVHMTVRPAEVGDDDMTQRSTKMTFGREREHREGSSPTCRCVIL
ncbi:ubiquitin-related domain-containing protein [Kalaharituber pfeilii]|nr:ubiquitin-related domain-containing protein [Kalaharituber pfeilii]